MMYINYGWIHLFKEISEDVYDKDKVIDLKGKDLNIHENESFRYSHAKWI